MPPLQVLCLGSSVSVAVLGALVRRNCVNGRVVGFVSLRTEVPGGKAGNFSERDPDPDVPASKIQMSDDILVCRKNVNMYMVQDSGVRIRWDYGVLNISMTK